MRMLLLEGREVVHVRYLSLTALLRAVQAEQMVPTEVREFQQVAAWESEEQVSVHSAESSKVSSAISSLRVPAVEADSISHRITLQEEAEVECC